MRSTVFFRTTLMLSVLMYLASCASGEVRVPLESYETVANSNLDLIITLRTGSVEYGNSTRMVSAGNNVFVTVPGEGRPEWAYGPSQQQAFISDLKTVLDNNSAFASTTTYRSAGEGCCDAELNIYFVSTEQRDDIPIYYLDVIVTLTTPHAEFKERHELQSNSIGQLYIEWKVTLDEARDRANNKLMRHILADLETWLPE